MFGKDGVGNVVNWIVNKNDMLTIINLTVSSFYLDVSVHVSQIVKIIMVMTFCRIIRLHIVQIHRSTVIIVSLSFQSTNEVCQ